jgi:two-component system heavy metal sensor histidine kinase CusS
MQGKLELVRHLLARLNEQEDLQAVREHLADALVGHEHVGVAVLRGPGDVVFQTAGLVLPDDLLRTSARSHDEPYEWRMQGRTYRAITESVSTRIAGRQPLMVAVVVDTEHHEHFMEAFRSDLLLALAIGIGLSALLGWAAARGGLAPVRKLAQAVRGVSAGRLDERVPTASMPAELVDLGNAFNQMLAQLQDSFDRLRHFSSDIAHELRTPISNLMLQTQVAASKARTADEYREVLYSNLEEYERLAKMIGDMLFLAQADNGLAVPTRSPIDLSEEMQAMFGFYEALAEENGVRLELEGSGRVDGDRLMIRRAISNLLGNAIRQTPRGKTVRSTLAERPDGGCTLRMTNPGSIAPEHLPRLFDRFYRVDPARQSGHGGAGLGLAITRSIVTAHGGTIRAESAAGEVSFTIAWPAPSPALAEGQTPTSPAPA